jgi:hypothetical protein
MFGRQIQNTGRAGFGEKSVRGHARGNRQMKTQDENLRALERSQQPPVKLEA